MSSLERAKAFVARGKRLAATVVPIAAMAVAVNAASAGTMTVTTPPTLIGYSGGVFSITCSGCGFQTSALPTLNGLDGVKVTGYSTGVLTAGAGITLFMDGTFQGLQGNLPADIPYSWDFTFQIDRDVPEPVTIPLSYGVRLAVSGSTGVYNNFWDSVDLLSGQATRITGSTVLQGTGAVVAPETWSLALFLVWDEPSPEPTLKPEENDTFTLTVPTNSVDINYASSAVPEPSALLLVAPGLALLAWKRTRARRG